MSVLLFEDDEGQALLTREALEREGFRVEVAGTGREGLDRLAQHDYHVYLIDMQLPDMRGVEILRRVKTLRPDAMSIIVTGHGDESAAVDAMKLGAYDYIVKSPSMGHLTALPIVIREGLERHQLKLEREQLQTEVWEHARLLEERNAELRRINEELKRIDQLRSDLVSTVSHELRTPLATIKEFTLILDDEVAGPLTNDQREYLGIVRENVERLSRMINDLLDMAKLEAGRVVLRKDFVQVGPLLEHVRQSLKPLAEEKQLELAVHPPQALLGVFADPDKVAQVLLNLVSNAIKYTPGPGRVTLEAAEQEHEVEFAVRDTGVGIAPEDVPKLFERFQQLSEETHPVNTKVKGTGLGLAISKGLVELHGGHIWATSGIGQGSTFSFTLPKYRPEEAFHEYLRVGLEQAKRKQGCLSFVVLSIVNFSELRAHYSSEHVGELLRQVEQVLKKTIRRDAGDIVVRWPQGEMVVIVGETDRAGAQAIARRLRQAIEQQPFQAGSAALSLSVSTAIATFPDDGVTEEELLQAVERQAKGIERPRTRVMVVDDEPKIRDVFQEILEANRYDVLVAASGQDALEQLKSSHVDLILLDILMPVMDGYEVYHLLKESPQTKDIPVIMVTATGERKDRQLGMESSTYNYLMKPVEMEELMAKIRDVLVRHVRGVA